MTTYWLNGERDGPKIPKYPRKTMTLNENESMAGVLLRQRNPALLNGLNYLFEANNNNNGNGRETSSGSSSQRFNNLLSNVAQLLHRLNDATVVQLGRHFARAGGHNVCTGNCHRKHSDTSTDTSDIKDFDFLKIAEEDYISAWRKEGKKRSQETGKSDIVEKNEESETEEETKETETTDDNGQEETKQNEPEEIE